MSHQFAYADEEVNDLIEGLEIGLKGKSIPHVAVLTQNIFCSTGKGGGVDPSCEKEGGSGGGDNTSSQEKPAEEKKGTKDYPNKEKQYMDMELLLRGKSPAELENIAKSYGVKDKDLTNPHGMVEAIMQKQKEKDIPKETRIQSSVPKDKTTMFQELKQVPTKDIQTMVKAGFAKELKVKDKVDQGLETLISKKPEMFEPTFTQKLANKIVDLFTGELPKEQRGGFFHNLKNAMDVFSGGRAELEKEYGAVTGNAIAGAALLGKIGGGIAGGTVGFGITASLLNWIGGTFVTAFGGNVGNKTGSQRLIEAQIKTIGGGIKLGANAGALITSLPLIALAHTMRGLRKSPTTNMEKETPTQKGNLTQQQINKIATQWLAEMEKKIMSQPLQSAVSVENNLRIHPLLITQNVFCATGKGGGVDPSCGKGDGSPGTVAEKIGNAIRGLTKKDLKSVDAEHFVNELFKKHGIKATDLKSLKGEKTGIYSAKSLKEMKSKLANKIKNRQRWDDRGDVIAKEFTEDLPEAEVVEDKMINLPEDFPPPVSVAKSSEKAWRENMKQEMTPEEHQELYKEKEDTIPRADLAKEAWKESMKKELTHEEWNQLYGDKPEVVVLPPKEKKHKESVDRVSDAKKFQEDYEKVNRRRLFE